MLIGQMGNITGLAAADLLTGKARPSGKLTDTWAENYGDYPSSATFSHNDGDISDEYYTEGIYVGYRYFDTFGVKPAYEFGFGRSYTVFSMETEGAEADGTDILLRIRVQNTGKEYAGREVAQVYVSAPAGKIAKPMQELRAFAKTRTLQPGEEEILSLRIRAESLASYCAECSAWVLEAGDYLFRVGNSSRNTRPAAVLRVPETVVTARVKHLFRDPDPALREIAPAGNARPAQAEAGGPGLPLLRDEWGFRGMVMTDWLTTSDLSAQLAAGVQLKYGKSDAALCVKAQNDLVEPGEKADFERILEGLRQGIISRAHLERNARNILTLMLRTHLYGGLPYNETVPGRCITFTRE